MAKLNGSYGATRGNSSSKGGSTLKPPSQGSTPSKKPGSTKTEGGKTYIQSGSGMWVERDSAAGQRVQSQYGSSGGSSGGSAGYVNSTKTLSAYTGAGGSGGASGGFKLPANAGTAAKRYVPTTTISKTDPDYGKKGIARMKNGMMATQKYMDEHPDSDYYTMDSNPHINVTGVSGGVPRYSKPGFTPSKLYQGATVGADGILYYPDGVNVPEAAWAANQASGDWATGGRREGMPEEYYRVYDDLAAGRGHNGYGLPAGSEAYNAIWGSGGRDQDAYNAMVAAGKAAPYYDPWEGTGYGNGGGYTGDTRTLGAYTATPNYDSYLEDALDANDMRTQLAQRQWTDQIPDVQAQGEDAARQAYINRMMSEQALPQQLAALGLSGGASESSMMDLNSSYENSRNSILQSRDDAIRNLNNQAAYAGMQGDANAASIEAQFRQWQAQQQAAAQQAAAERAWQAQQDELNRQWQAQQADKQFANQKELADYNAKLKAMYSGSGGSTRPKLSFSEVEKQLQAGNVTDQLLAAYRDYIGADWTPTLSDEAKSFKAAMDNNINKNAGHYQNVGDGYRIQGITAAIEQSRASGRISPLDRLILYNAYGIEPIDRG